MVAKVFTSAIIGIDGQLVEVEVDIRRGLNHFEIVGLPGKAVKEAKERVESAIKNSGFQFPNGRIAVNLAPADVPKNSSLYDLPIAISILTVTKQIEIPKEKSLFAGELSLDGNTKVISGAIVIADFARKNGFKKVFFPWESTQEAKMIKNIEVLGITNLKDLNNFENLYCNTKSGQGNRSNFMIQKSGINLLKGDHSISHEVVNISPNLSGIKGQKTAKRVLEIAAAGGHNLLMIGSPGSGKTMLGRCMNGILPKMSLGEKIEVTKIYSSASLLKRNSGIVESRPFRNPHYKISQAAMIGGGINPKPGEISLAHRGILFLDEFSEFSNSVVESLRQPLEDREVVISRVHGAVCYPSSFILIAAMNPCRCGYFGDTLKECLCSESEIEKYRKKISGPVLDRIDLQIRVRRVTYTEVSSKVNEEKSEAVANRVSLARQAQKDRYEKNGHHEQITNSEMTTKDIDRWAKTDLKSSSLLSDAVSKFGLSARSYFRILKVARTIADLDQRESIKKEDIAEALSYRL